jgi:cytochrome c553
VPLVKAFLAFRGAFRASAIVLGLGAPLAVTGIYFRQTAEKQPPVRIPSYVAWTEENITAANSGDAVRGLVLARRCEKCHGREGFSPESQVPNLAGIDRLTIWKQLNDFRSGKRTSPVMQAIANELAIPDYADLAAYFSMLPTYPDRGDTRSFPQMPSSATNGPTTARLIAAGDGRRGIPPCQVCHGPVGHDKGAPSLATQNAEYIRGELEKFANGTRTNDINMPMRSIASQLTDDEKQSVATYYGTGSATLLAGGQK